MESDGSFRHHRDGRATPRPARPSGVADATSAAITAAVHPLRPGHPGPDPGAVQCGRDARRRGDRRLTGDAHPARRVVVVHLGDELSEHARCAPDRPRLRRHRPAPADLDARPALRAPDPDRADLRHPAPPPRLPGGDGGHPAGRLHVDPAQRRDPLSAASVGDHGGHRGGLAPRRRKPRAPPRHPPRARERAGLRRPLSRPSASSHSPAASMAHRAGEQPYGDSGPARSARSAGRSSSPSPDKRSHRG
jgi:hypothetical protein